MRCGIVGTNFISEWLIADARRTGGLIEPVAVYSRSQERAEQFAAAHGLAAAFSDFAAMVDSVDVVYVASPTYAHFAQAMQAIEAGKHVIVEKTMTQNVEEAEALFNAAVRRGVVVMEATRNLHAPAQQVIRDALGTLGTIRYVHCEKQQYSSRYDRVRAGETLNAFDPTLGNSAIADIGVYCLEPVLDLFGVPGRSCGASVRLANGFEAAGSLQLAYDSMLVDVTYSKIAHSHRPSEIIGEDGCLLIDDISEPHHIERRLRGGVPEVLWDDTEAAAGPSSVMHHELIAFAGFVEAGACPPHFQEVSIAARRLMDEQLARTA